MTTERATGGIRLATFNLKHGAPADKYRGEPELAAAACAELNADILALQEVDKSVPRSRRADLAALAAKASGMEVVFARTMWFHGGRYGNALLVRGEISDFETLRLKGDHRHRIRIRGRQFLIGREPRNAILATACLEQGEVSVAATHLSTERQVSRRQLTEVMAALACRQAPQVLMGDLNLSRTSVSKHPSLESMDLAEAPPTFPSTNPRKSIDHIAVNGLTIQSAETVKFPISDHLALIANASIPKT